MNEGQKHPTNQKGNGSIQQGVSKSKLNEPLGAEHDARTTQI